MKKIALCTLLLTSFLTHAGVPTQNELAEKTSVRVFHCQLKKHEAFNQIDFFVPLKSLSGTVTGKVDGEFTLISNKEFYTLKVPSTVKVEGEDFPRARLGVDVYFTYPGDIENLKGFIDFTETQGEVETTFISTVREDEDDDEPRIEKIKATCSVR